MPPKDQTPYDQLREAILDYGDAAMENLLRCRALGRSIVAALPGYMGCGADCISLVPSQGAFDPSKDYGDQAFSFNDQGVIRLEPILFGICITVPHAEDSGSVWLRTGIRLEVSGGGFDVYVSHQPMIRVPLEFEGALTPVCETIHREFLGVFRKELAHFSDERFAGGIGFIPNS